MIFLFAQNDTILGLFTKSSAFSTSLFLLTKFPAPQFKLLDKE
jgi:hypothetical protein